MTEDTIQERIDKLEAEMATLQINHENTVKQHNQVVQQFNQIVTQNQTRYSALKGGVAELTALKEQMKLNGNVDETVPETNRTGDVMNLSSR